MSWVYCDPKSIIKILFFCKSVIKDMLLKTVINTLYFNEN